MHAHPALSLPVARLPHRAGRVSLGEMLILAAAAIFALSAMGGFVVTGHSYHGASLNPVWFSALAVVALGAAVGRHWSAEIGAALRYWGYFFFISILGSLCGTLLASAAMPLIDSQLIAADRLIGFD